MYVEWHPPYLILNCTSNGPTVYNLYAHIVVCPYTYRTHQQREVKLWSFTCHWKASCLERSINYSGSALLKFNGLASSGQNRIILLRTFCIIIVTIRDMLSYQLYTCRSPSEKRTRSVHLWVRLVIVAPPTEPSQLKSRAQTEIYGFIPSSSTVSLGSSKSIITRHVQEYVVNAVSVTDYLCLESQLL